MESAIKLVVSRDGLIDLLCKVQQACDIGGGVLKNSGEHGNGIMSFICGAYLEALAAGLERGLDEVIAQQLVPLVEAVSTASGEEGVADEIHELQAQIEEFIETIKVERESKLRPGLVLVPENGTVH